MADQEKPKLTLDTNVATMGAEEMSVPVKSISPPWKQLERDEREILAKAENKPILPEAEEKAKTAERVAHARKISGESQEALLKVQNKITAAKLGIDTENKGEASSQKEKDEAPAVSRPPWQRRSFVRDVLAYKFSLEAAGPFGGGSSRKTSEVTVPIEKKTAKAIPDSKTDSMTLAAALSIGMDVPINAAFAESSSKPSKPSTSSPVSTVSSTTSPTAADIVDKVVSTAAAAVDGAAYAASNVAAKAMEAAKQVTDAAVKSRANFGKSINPGLGDYENLMPQLLVGAESKKKGEDNEDNKSPQSDPGQSVQGKDMPAKDGKSGKSKGGSLSSTI